VAAPRGRQITNFGGFFDPFAIGAGSALTPIALWLEARETGLELLKRGSQFQLEDRSSALELLRRDSRFELEDRSSALELRGEPVERET
jgi:hypothetical protein